MDHKTKQNDDAKNLIQRRRLVIEDSTSISSHREYQNMAFIPQNHDEHHPPNYTARSLAPPYQHFDVQTTRSVDKLRYQQFMAQEYFRNINIVYNNENMGSTSNNAEVGGVQQPKNKGCREAYRIKPGESIMMLDRHSALPPPPLLCPIKYNTYNPFDFKQDKHSVVKRLFEDIMTSEPRDTLFYNQALLILTKSKSRKKSGLKKIDHQCISCADEVYILHRNPRGQIYFMKDLHLHVHFTVSQVQRQVVDFVLEEKGRVVDIQPTENIIREDYAVWNKDDWDGKEGHKFLSDTSELIEKVFPGFQGMMKIPQKGDSRGTIAANLGLTVNDCNQYVHNRSTIFGNIRPYLIKLDCIQDKSALKSLGKLVVYTFKDILPRFGQQKHFQLSSKTKAGVARMELRREFAKSLHLDKEEDFSYFLAEAISIIIPIIVFPHRDGSNDTVENQSGTVTINCSLRTSIITNKHLKTYLQNLGYIDTFPCSVIFYSRACCGTYYRRIRALSKLEKKSTIGKSIVSSVKIAQNRDEKDYIGRIFDNTEYLASIIRKMEGKISNEYAHRLQITHHEQGTDEQNEISDSFQAVVPACNCFNELDDVSKERMSCSRSIHVNNVLDVVPFSYDVMSKWSIVFDCALEIHFHLKPLTAEIILLYIICVVIDGIDGLICLIHQELSSGIICDDDEHHGEKVFTRLVNEMKRLISRKRGICKSELMSLLENIMEKFNSTRGHLSKMKKDTTKIRQIVESCDDLLQGLISDSDQCTHLQLKNQEGKDFIHLAAIFGLLPLECIAWASVHPFDKLSEKITELNGAKDIQRQRDLFQYTSRYLVKKISIQSTGTLLQNILLSHDGPNLQPHYYYYHPHRSAIQHFYRVKKEAQWELQMLRSSPFEWKSCHPRTTTVTKWNSDDDTFMKWLLIDDKITCKSSLVVPNEFKKLFFSKFKVKCHHFKRRRIEESSEAVTS